MDDERGSVKEAHSFYNWVMGDEDEARVAAFVANMVASHVGMAADDIMFSGRLFLQSEPGEAYFEFSVTDAGDIGAKFSVDDILLCIEDKESAIAFLQKLIERVRSS